MPFAFRREADESLRQRSQIRIWMWRASVIRSGVLYGDNASIVNHLENQKLKQLYRCPYCGSSDYNEEIVYI